MPKRIPLCLALLILTLSLLAPTPASAQPQPAMPFSLPFAGPPGPDTWLMVQPYGNTVGAYYQRVNWYFAGQGLHFGLDLSAPCGTQIVAIADGVVNEIDEEIHGALPHSLMIHHAGNYASFYGHLLQTPQLFIGQEVKRGQVVALSGDPDFSCTSRPHLHLEIRDYSHSMAFNPIPLIDADWQTIALIGGFRRGFAQDLANPQRWQYMDDQPDVHFGGPLLNDYAAVWPPDW